VSALGLFLERGVTVVTTRRNFERQKEMLGTRANSPEAAARVRFVEDEPFRISDGKTEVVAHRFERKDFPATPTEDYLYFHLPRQDALHCGCMYTRYSGPPVQGRELLTRRSEDLHAFIRKRGLAVASLLRTAREPSPADQLLPFSELRRIVDEGVRARDLLALYRALPLETLRRRRTELTVELVRDGIPGPLLNDLAFEALGTGDLERALELATLQALVNPSDANAWDTLGEAHYFLGAVEVARAYEQQSRRIDPSLHRGGESAWKRDLEQLRAGWKAAPAR
jgi:hypothetical protein